MSTVEIAQRLAEMGRTEEARGMLRRALSVAEDGRAAAALAMLLLDGTNLPEAVALGRRALAAAPHDPMLLGLHRAIGSVLYRNHFWEDASQWLDRASALEPWDPALANMAERARVPDYLAPVVSDPTHGPLRRYGPREGGAYIYVIDIMGTCNLRCPTCPVGNSELGARPRGMMKPELFAQIVAKIRRESPSPRPQINLFNWGEPLLHPHLPDFIAQLRAAGMASHLSSNLNIKTGLDAVIAAGPDDLKISLSGFTPDSYGRTHVGGDLQMVQRNLLALRTSMDRHQAKTHVWVCQHLYRSNQDDIAPVREMCARLGFTYAPINAFYMPIERLGAYLRGQDNPADGGIIKQLLTDPRDAARLRRLHQVRGFDCELRFNQTVINHDGRVALCCAVYDQDNMLGVDFLDADHAELERRKYAHPYCATCMKAGMHYTAARLSADAPPD